MKQTQIVSSHAKPPLKPSELLHDPRDVRVHFEATLETALKEQGIYTSSISPESLSNPILDLAQEVTFEAIEHFIDFNRTPKSSSSTLYSNQFGSTEIPVAHLSVNRFREGIRVLIEPAQEALHSNELSRVKEAVENLGITANSLGFSRTQRVMKRRDSEYIEAARVFVAASSPELRDTHRYGVALERINQLSSRELLSLAVLHSPLEKWKGESAGYGFYSDRQTGKLHLPNHEITVMTENRFSEKLPRGPLKNTFGDSTFWVEKFSDSGESIQREYFSTSDKRLKQFRTYGQLFVGEALCTTQNTF